jgi:putative transposase
VEVRSKPEGQKGFKPVPIRWVVEQTHAILGRCHRLSRDYEYETSSSAAWVQISAIQQMVRRLRPDAEHRQPPFKYPKNKKKVA